MTKKKLQYSPRDVAFGIFIFIIILSQSMSDVSNRKPFWAILLFALLMGTVAVFSWPVRNYMRDHMSGVRDMGLTIVGGMIAMILICIIVFLYASA